MAKGRCSVATSAAVRNACHARTADQYMSFARDTSGFADKADKRIARIVRVGIRTRMTDITRPIHFPGRNAGESYMRPLCTPYRSISIPDTHWRAVE